MIDETNLGWTALCLAMGVGATLTLDLWAQLLKRTAGIPATDWALVGRWFAGLPRGRFSLQAHPAVRPLRYELALGWIAHYGIGIAYAFLYLALLQLVYVPVSLWSAAAFGFATVLAPWLILMPALGKGRFGAATPNPGLTRLLSLGAHLVFGAALYLAWRLASAVL